MFLGGCKSDITTICSCAVNLAKCMIAALHLQKIKPKIFAIALPNLQ
jgi:hypothetical protein